MIEAEFDIRRNTERRRRIFRKAAGVDEPALALQEARVMRIAYVCADLGIPVFGRKGCSIHVQELIRALSRLGGRIELFTPRAEGDPLPDLGRVRVHPFPAPAVDVAAREQAALAANHHLRATLDREGPFDLVYERYSLWSYAGMEYARAAKTPGLLEVNAPLIEEQALHRTLVDRRSAEAVAERAFANASSLIAVSREVALYLERFPGARGRVHVIANGVNPDRFPPGLPPARPGAPGTFTVGFVGTLKPWHGLSTLVEGFDRLHQRDRHTRMLIVGDGPERPTLIRDINARGLGDAVCLTGAVAPGEIPGLLASMDVGVAPYPPSAHFYFSPLKVYEYLAAGLPVVASNLGQLEEVIEHGVNGLLCSPGDPAALAGALACLREEAGLRYRLSKAARATVLRQHTWDAVARRVLALGGVALPLRLGGEELRN